MIFMDFLSRDIPVIFMLPAKIRFESKDRSALLCRLSYPGYIKSKDLAHDR